MANARTQTDQTESADDAARRMAARVLELERERDQLKERVQVLEAEAQARPGGARPAPVTASFGMSEGVRAELEANRDNPDYITRDPFTGEERTVADLEEHESKRRK